MPAIVKVVNMYTKTPDGMAINTTASSGQWATLSPFIIGPCELYDGHVSRNMENAWQFAKLHPKLADAKGEPTPAYWEWAQKGWNDPVAHRFPMGKGAIPLCSLWQGRRLGYIEARKAIYGPLYAQAVQKTSGWAELQTAYRNCRQIYLRDYDGYDHDAAEATLSQVLNNPRKIMGHAFILKMLLTDDPALKELELR